MSKEKLVSELAAATIWQAAKDYVSTKCDRQRKSILRDLRSDWMQFFTNGLSVVVAKELERNPDEIRKRIKLKKPMATAAIKLSA